MTEDHTRIDELIERSSLGTRGARRLRHRTPAAIAQDLLEDPATITAETREAGALLAGGVDRDLEAVRESARAAVALIRPLVQRYCRARARRDDLVDEQTEAIVDAACAEIERDLITHLDLADEPRLLSHAYRIANRYVCAANERDLGVPRGDERTPRVEPHGALAAAVDQLDTVEREVIVLRVAVGLSATETADALGLKPAAVRRLQHSALRTLRRTIDP